MESQQDRKPPAQPRLPKTPPPAPKKRFRLVKLEERVAPRKGGANSSATDSLGGGKSVLF